MQVDWLTCELFWIKILFKLTISHFYTFELLIINSFKKYLLSVCMSTRMNLIISVYLFVIIILIETLHLKSFWIFMIHKTISFMWRIHGEVIFIRQHVLIICATVFGINYVFKSFCLFWYFFIINQFLHVVWGSQNGFIIDIIFKSILILTFKLYFRRASW